MLELYVWLSNRLADRGEVGLEYVVLAAVIGTGVLLGATVFQGAIKAAFNHLVNLVNGAAP